MQYRDLIYRIHARQAMFTRSISDCFIRTQSCGERTIQHLSPPASPHAPRLADLVIRAGAIYSMAQDRDVYQAIAIHDEWIVAVSLDPNGLDGLIGAGGFPLDPHHLSDRRSPVAAAHLHDGGRSSSLRS